MNLIEAAMEIMTLTDKQLELIDETYISKLKVKETIVSFLKGCCEEQMMAQWLLKELNLDE